MWPSENLASRLYDLANFGLIASLVVGVISTGIVVWMGNVKEAYSRRDLAQTREKTEKLEGENLTFRGQVAKLEIEAADAKTRELAAEKELLKLKNPRSLSSEAIAILRKGPHGKAIIQCLVDVPETKMFAGNLYGTLFNAGWDMSGSQTVVPVKSFNVDVALSDVFVLGRTINGIDDPTTPIGALFRALKKDGYKPGAMLIPSAKDDTLIILVSHRP